MLKPLLSVLLSVALAAQAAETITPSRSVDTVTVTLRVYESRSAVVQECQRLGAWADLSVKQVLKEHPAPGCSAYDPGANTCTIHALAPQNVEDADRMENIGHETLHCFRGSYHVQH